VESKWILHFSIITKQPLSWTPNVAQFSSEISWPISTKLIWYIYGILLILASSWLAIFTSQDRFFLCSLICSLCKTFVCIHCDGRRIARKQRERSMREDAFYFYVEESRLRSVFVQSQLHRYPNPYLLHICNQPLCFPAIYIIYIYI